MASSPDKNPSTYVIRRARNPIAGRTDVDSAQKSSARSKGFGEQLERNKKAERDKEAASRA